MSILPHKSLKSQGIYQTSLDPSWQIQEHHQNRPGFISMYSKVPKEINGEERSQWHYPSDKINEVVDTWTGNDVYFSQNAFKTPWRSGLNIYEFRAIYVDIDCHKINITADRCLSILEMDYFDSIVPLPNRITFSGQGLQLVWFVEPAPYEYYPLWQTIENYFTGVLSELNSDPASRDSTRVLRLVGTQNSKNNETVYTLETNNYRHDLVDLFYDYLPEATDLPEKITRIKPSKKIHKKHPSTNKNNLPKGKLYYNFNEHSLYFARFTDLERLVELRKGNCEGTRELILFLYRYWQCLYFESPESALENVKALNKCFAIPLPIKELEKATMSAEKMYKLANWNDDETVKQREQALKKIQKVNPDYSLGYRYSNEKLIKLLEISPDEQENLSTIISRNEVRRRDYLKRAEKRRDEGKKDRKAAKAENLKRLRQAIDENPDATVRELGTLLQLTFSYTSKLKRELESH